MSDNHDSAGSPIDRLGGIFDISEMLKCDGYDDCVIGVVERFGSEPVLCYDRGAMIAKLMADGMTEDEAEEFFEFNILGAWCGATTPCFVTLVPRG